MTNESELHTQELYAQIEDLQAQLATAHAEQWGLIRDVCHELRLPLSSIKGYNDLMPLMGPISDQQKDFVTRIKKNVARMSGMIDNLHSLAYMGEGKFKLELRVLPPILTIEDICDEMQSLATERQNTLVCDLPDELPSIWVDPERFKQILHILIENACLYTPSGGQVTVAASPTDDGFVKISVTDTGIGVPEEEREKLFTLFFRGDNDLVREQTGAGMNLYMLRRFVELMKGTYGTEFPPEGGSHFWVCLPVIG